MPRSQTVPIPSGVVTRMLQINASATVYGGSSSLEVQVIPNFDGADVRLIKWLNTQQYLINFFDVKRGSPDQGLFVEIPIVDQPGFVLGNADEPIQNWFYTVKVRYLYDGRKVGATVTKTVVPTGDSPMLIIFDDLPTGNTPSVYQGPRGYSAYQLALQEGFNGTIEEWLDSLEGKPGAPGAPGRDGENGHSIIGPQGPTGPTGPPGPQGESSRQYYIHNQGVALDAWVINHPLPFIPNIVIVDSTGTVVEGEIQYTSPSQVVISFSGGFSGTAYLS